MNKVILMGRLTRDPEVRYSQGERQMAIARYTLAVDRRGRANTSNGEQTADFIQCVAFDRSAEFAEKYFHQGTKLVVTGRIQTGSYTNKDGQKVYTTDVIVEDQSLRGSGVCREQVSKCRFRQWRLQTGNVSVQTRAGKRSCKRIYEHPRRRRRRRTSI